MLETLVIYSTITILANTVIIFINTKALWKAIEQNA